MTPSRPLKPSANFRAQRLFVDAPLHEGAQPELGKAQAHYLRNVLRLKPGSGILLFNGRDGEWQARLLEVTRNSCRLEVRTRTRPQHGGPDIVYLFAPLKRARLDYMVQKATEMGVARLQPVLTAHTQTSRINLARMRANAIEAAEQCGILRLPEISPPEKLTTFLATRNEKRHLIFCDEGADIIPPLDRLKEIGRRPCAVLIGPEGGFSQEERARLTAAPQVTPLSLGPRILRADTAAIAALALINATLGDWT